LVRSVIISPQKQSTKFGSGIFQTVKIKLLAHSLSLLRCSELNFWCEGVIKDYGFIIVPSLLVLATMLSSFVFI